MRKKIFFVIRILITLAIFFALFKFIPYPKLVSVYKNAHKIWLVCALFVFSLTFLTGVVRWKFLLSACGIKAAFREVFYSSFSGLFFNLFFPSFVAGDILKGFGISCRYGSPKRIASTVVMDRFCGGLALTLIAVGGLMLSGRMRQQKQVLLPVLLLCLVVVFLSLVIFSRPFFTFLIRIFKKESAIRRRLSSFHDQLYFLKEHPPVFYKALGFSFIIQLLMPIGFYVASLAFGLNLSFIIFLVLIPVVTAIAFIPITIAGAGTREALMVYFLSFYGVSESVALGISLVNFVFLIAAGILGGILYVTVYHRWLQPGS